MPPVQRRPPRVRRPPAIDANSMLSNRPTRCRLWQKADLTPADLRPQDFSALETYLEESHHMRRLLQCRECGQLFFYAFTEEIDWAAGNDPQYRVYIPVGSAAEARRLSALDTAELLTLLPRLHVDWPAAAESPRVRWVGPLEITAKNTL